MLAGMSLRYAPCLLLALAVGGCLGLGSDKTASPDRLPDAALEPMPGTRRWLGPRFWANRLQDWRSHDGRIECVTPQGWRPLRTVHDLVHELVPGDEVVVVRARVDRLNTDGDQARDAAAGFLVGVGPDLEHRARALVFGHHAKGGGLFAGIDGRGVCFLKDNATGRVIETASGDAGGDMPQSVVLECAFMPSAGRSWALVTAKDPSSGAVLQHLEAEVPGELLVGGLALVSHPGTRRPNVTPGHFGFSKWRVVGRQVVQHPERALGPVLACQHTVSRGILKLNAQFLPLAADDPRQAKLEVQRNGSWSEVATARIQPVSHTALFRVAGFHASNDVPYRVVHDLPLATGKPGRSCRTTFTGRIPRDPKDRDQLRLAAMNCAVHRPWGRPRDWKTDLFFPHHDLVERVTAQSPDLLFFAGDQIYEGTPSPADRRHLHEDYLYKWYLWCWAFRELTRVLPAVTIPDDHDVYQGNLWGAGGRKAPGRDNTGGYVHPASFVNLVHRTQTAHLPDPHDPTPIAQDISVYYTDLVHGGVSFAILGDRMFKSGCAGVGLPPSKTGRPDHYQDPDLDPRKLDLPGLMLLGRRQLDFLARWAGDWRSGAEMKVVLSQSPFAGLSTHHGPKLRPLSMDLDANGWPQSGRDRAVAALRRARAIHVTGDQHLATLAQHGLDRHRDAVWSFTAPSVANAYARAYVPECPGEYRPPASPKEYTGDRLDALGNRITVHAVANPGDRKTDWPQLHDKVPGYGIVVIDKQARTYTVECWPRFADPKDPAQQYEGWPLTIRQEDNDGRGPVGSFPVVVEGLARPVVRLYDEASGKLVFAARMSAARFTVPIYQDTSHLLEIGDPDTAAGGTSRWRRFMGIGAAVRPGTKIEARF
jgi:hypothetical protein